MKDVTMTPNRPYLIRALYDWILDNGMTPHILADGEYPGIIVPARFVEGGKIVLNISPEAVQYLSLGMDEILFSARFNGEPCSITIPVNAVLAIYARENGQGMVFPEEKKPEDPGLSRDNVPARRKPGLKVVK